MKRHRARRPGSRVGLYASSLCGVTSRLSSLWMAVAVTEE